MQEYSQRSWLSQTFAGTSRLYFCLSTRQRWSELQIPDLGRCRWAYHLSGICLLTLLQGALQFLFWFGEGLLDANLVVVEERDIPYYKFLCQRSSSYMESGDLGRVWCCVRLQAPDGQAKPVLHMSFDADSVRLSYYDQAFTVSGRHLVMA